MKSISPIQDKQLDTNVKNSICGGENIFSGRRYREDAQQSPCQPKTCRGGLSRPLLPASGTTDALRYAEADGESAAVYLHFTAMTGFFSATLGNCTPVHVSAVSSDFSKLIAHSESELSNSCLDLMR